ncbi:hypothetical protein AMATHDRAFT_135346 [Amanita thiersii Skay4041]|uniref:Uncharacterized protein n=1 Tax=Amanita thiersii Skay4041 TaxID=703135 RepID=A0A2A9NV20_9AGAR|nr:hypothetical protein AMATHDRAFT_135346 [Amanita thiersii Skay4041]
MSVRGTDNLRCYLREASLPPMVCDPKAPALPEKGHKSHLNNLHVCPEPWRKLESIQPIDATKLDEKIIQWVDSFIPETSIGVEDSDPLTGETLTVPCPPVFDIPTHVERRPNDIFRMVPWLDNFPLMTIQRALHLIHGPSNFWGFSLHDDNDKDRNIFQHFHWGWSLPQNEDLGGSEDTVSKRRIGRHSVVIAFQPPWVLSHQDITEFSQCRSFPPYLLPGNAFPTSFESKHRLWAKLWDLCVHEYTPWFVLTSYHHWVFGVFSTGWTTAFVSGVYDYNYFSPTILECLTFWVGSALRIRGTWAIPDVL